MVNRLLVCWWQRVTTGTFLWRFSLDAAGIARDASDSGRHLCQCLLQHGKSKPVLGGAGRSQKGEKASHDVKQRIVGFILLLALLSLTTPVLAQEPGMPFVADVTIPGDTVVQPDERFHIHNDMDTREQQKSSWAGTLGLVVAMDATMSVLNIRAVAHIRGGD